MITSTLFLKQVLELADILGFNIKKLDIGQMFDVPGDTNYFIQYMENTINHKHDSSMIKGNTYTALSDKLNAIKLSYRNLSDNLTWECVKLVLSEEVLLCNEKDLISIKIKDEFGNILNFKASATQPTQIRISCIIATSNLFAFIKQMNIDYEWLILDTYNIIEEAYNQ